MEVLVKHFCLCKCPQLRCWGCNNSNNANYWLTQTWSNFWSRTTPSLDLEVLRIGGSSSSTMIGTSVWMETSINIEGKLPHWWSMCNLCICCITLSKQSDGEHNESLWRMLRSWWVPVNLNRATQCWDWGVFLNGKLSWLTIIGVFSLWENFPWLVV